MMEWSRLLEDVLVNDFESYLIIYGNVMRCVSVSMAGAACARHRAHMVSGARSRRLPILRRGSPV
jgi:hypothetical protein